MSGAGCYSACACRVERLASDSRYPAIDDRAALGHDLSGLDCEVRSRIRSRSISAGIAATMNSILSGDHVPAGTVQPDADAGQSLQVDAAAWSRGHDLRAEMEIQHVGWWPAGQTARRY